MSKKKKIRILKTLKALLREGYWHIRCIYDEDYFINNLRKHGAKIGEHVTIYNSTIDRGFCFLIEIGNNVTITNSTVLAHDASTQLYLRKTKVAKTRIGNHVFIGWGSIVLPGITIGDNVIIGAGSVVTKNIPGNSLVAGNPAKVIGNTADFINAHKESMKTHPVYNTYWQLKTPDEINQMINELNDTWGYDE